MVLKKQKKENRKLSIYMRWTRLVVIPIMLFTLWMVLSLLYSTSKASPTILIHEHAKENITSGDKSELLKGEIITGEFEAREDNLGIVAVRFNTFLRINDDIVRFRIKEKGSNKWYYENDYTTPQFQPDDLFTFGFPIISNSEGKTFQFEVESRQGEPENAVALSPIEPVFITKYQYSKAEILSNRDYLLTFAQRKIINTFSNVDFLLSFFAYSLPLILYLIWLFFFEKYLYNKYYLILIPIGLMILISILNPPNNDAIVIGLTGLWIAQSYAYRLKTEISFYLALTLLITSAILLYSSFFEISKNFSMWSFMLLLSGVIIQLSEFRWERNKLVGLELFMLTQKRKEKP
jgi:hypothetical protein